MDKKPLISIITINFNDKVGLQKTFESVLGQTFQDFEFLVIDGGSTDGSKEVIEKNVDKINYWVSEPDKGIYNALNKGILASKGEYLFFLNAGDLFIDHFSLEKAAKHVHTEDIIYFNIKVLGAGRDFVKECPEKLDFYFFYKDTLPHQGSFMKATAFEKVGLYDENLKIISDWKWYMTAICFLNLTYKKINETFSIFFLDGISSLKYDEVLVERNEVLSKINHTFTGAGKLIDDQKAEIYRLQEFENKFNHLRKYRLVKLLGQLNIIKIPK